MKPIIAVALGGALGSVLRFLVQKTFNVSFPTGTLAVNLVGCFLAGWFWALFLRGLNGQAFLFLMTGFCGGFTTLSAFSVDSVQMMTTGRWMAFAFYVTGSIAGGMMATFFGYKIFSS